MVFNLLRQHNNNENDDSSILNCFKKWNVSTINVPLKNDLKNKNQIKSNLIMDNTETISDNKDYREYIREDILKYGFISLILSSCWIRFT